MTEEERRTAKPQSMTRRYRRGLILTGVLCVLAMLTAATPSALTPIWLTSVTATPPPTKRRTPTMPPPW